MFHLKLAKGEFEGCEDFFQARFELEKELRMKVYVQYSLAKIYIHESRNNEAIEALDYVITHGNKLHLVDEAKTLLSSIKS